ncbi:hypothetical protein COOONC_18317 [Cooperia oncophora]
METVIPKDRPVPKPSPVPKPNLPVVSNNSSSSSFEKGMIRKSALESSLTRKPAFESGMIRKEEQGIRKEHQERSESTSQANLANNDEQEKMERIKAELARMKREDEKAYELLLDVVNATMDPTSGGKEASVLADSSPAIRNLSTNKLFV